MDDVLVKITNTNSQTNKNRFTRWTSNDDLFALKNLETIENKQVVANCHKQDIRKFQKRILTLSELLESYLGLVALLNKENPELQILLSE